MNRFPRKKTRWTSAMFLAGLSLALATASSAAGAPAPVSSAESETPLTGVLINVGPNPSHYGQAVQFRWTATGFPNYANVRCTDDRNPHWIENAPYTGTVTKTAGVDFTGSFRWTVECGYEDFWGSGYEDVAYIPPPPPQVQIIGNDGDRLGIRNDHGDWWIAKRCLNSQYWQNHGLPPGRTTGPGYVSRVVRNNEVIVDDDGEPIDNRYFNSGGLGSFAYQHSKGNPYFLFAYDGGVNTFFVASRICSGDHPEAPGLFGVTETCCQLGPLTWDQNGALHWSIDVDLRTPWRNPILQIRYEYTFKQTAIELVTKVHTYCGSPGVRDPRCGNPFEEQFIKEPKFTAQVVPVPGDSVAVYDPLGIQLVRWTGGDPHQTTGQSGHDTRHRVTFSSSGLNIVARSYRLDLQYPYYWEGDGYGLDQWSVVASGYQSPPYTLDGPAPLRNGNKTVWDCNDTVPPKAPDAQGVRQWELVGRNTDYPFAAFFHGWEGGVGPNDCEPMARHFPPSDRVFANYFVYTITDPMP